MKYVDEYRNGTLARSIAAAIAAEVRPDRSYAFMEFCGGHTHAISRYDNRHLSVSVNLLGSVLVFAGIAQVAAANPHTVVVVESGSAVTMPWAGKVGGILEAWYAGSKGADAVANVLFGDVNPSGKLPITFPRSEADMPHPTMTLPTANQLGIANVMKSGEAKPTFEVHYDEGLKVGYKWYDAEHKEVLFPFGHGLSYTSFGYSGLKVDGSNPVTVKFSLKNSGARDGMEVAEVYAALPADAKEPPKRLVGWSKVLLKAGETREMEISIDPRYLSIYDEATNSWKLVPGAYTFFVGGSSQNFPVKEEIHLK